MNCYIVTFQAAELETRQRIRKHLKTYESYCAIHNTCWAIETAASAKSIRDDVAEIAGPQDRIFVIRSGTEAAWRNILNDSDKESSDWLKRKL